MKKLLLSITAVVFLAALTGCRCDRDWKTEMYSPSNLIYGQYLQSFDSDAVKELSLKPPIKIAVAEVGEITPAPAIMNSLLKQKKLFTILAELPGPDMNIPRRIDPEIRCRESYWRNRQNASLKAMFKAADNCGADFVLLISGRIVFSEQSDAWSALNILILPMFFMKSQKITANGQVSAILYESNTGAVRMVTNATLKDTESTAMAFTGNKVESMINPSVKKLSEKLAANVAADFEKLVAARKK